MRGDETLVPEAASSVSPNDSEVTSEDTLASSGLKRPQEDDADGEEHPPTRKARLEAVCSLVHGVLGRQEQKSKDRSETEGLTSAVMCRSSSGKQNCTQCARRELDASVVVQCMQTGTTSADERSDHGSKEGRAAEIRRARRA